MGFKRLNETVIHKASTLGTSEDVIVPLMVKMPSCARGLSFEKWREFGYPKWEEIKPEFQEMDTKTKGKPNK